MIIKKFVGRTEADATEAARRELGSGVVIMNVKTVKRRGLLSFFQSRQIEVTAALEEENDTLQSVRREAVPRVARTVMPAENRSPVSETAEGGWDMEDVPSAEDRLSIERKLDNLQALLVNRFQQSEAERRECAEDPDIQYAEGEDWEERPEEREEVSEQQRFIRLLYNTMLESEVDEKYANQIIEDIDMTGQSNLPLDYILSNVYQKMILKFGKAEGITSAEGKTKIVIFMGPTGVGKTTTIAKIASNYVVDEKKKVALLTSDTYRIAAVDQLRTYANILEVPFRVIYSEDDIAGSIAEFHDYDYIFVDTAGHSHQNEEQLEHTRSLVKAIAQAGESQTFLVLSATTKYRDLLKIISRYNQIGDFQLIFTKLDETDVQGNLLNIKLFTDTPIAFVTYGQNVPNDIEQFNPQKTVKNILSTRQEKNS